MLGALCCEWPGQPMWMEVSPHHKSMLKCACDCSGCLGGICTNRGRCCGRHLWQWP